jgi:hypothetical protein
MDPVTKPEIGPPIAPAKIMPTWKKWIRTPIKKGKLKRARRTVSVLDTDVKATRRVERFIVLPIWQIVILWTFNSC